jgi:hypothetical protein
MIKIKLLLTVLKADSGEEWAVLVGKVEEATNCKQYSVKQQFNVLIKQSNPQILCCAAVQFNRLARKGNIFVMA